MFHDLKLYLEQDEQSHDRYENLLHFYELIQDKPMMDNQELNTISAKQNQKLIEFLLNTFTGGSPGRVTSLERT